MGQTVNLLSFDFGGSNPSLPTKREANLFASLFVCNPFLLYSSSLASALLSAEVMSYFRGGECLSPRRDRCLSA